MDYQLRSRLRTLLPMLLEATEMEGIKAWALNTAFKYAMEMAPEANPTALWRYLGHLYEENLRSAHPDQLDPGRSYRRASADAWAHFLEEYLNDSRVLQREGIRGMRLKGRDFERLMNRLELHGDLRPRGIDLFLQGIDERGMPQVFGALFAKANFAGRIRREEDASRALRREGLWSASVTLDARDELGSQEHPTVKRDTINRGGFDACYSLNRDTIPGGRVFVVDLRQRGIRANPLVRGIIQAWRIYQQAEVEGQARLGPAFSS